MMTGSKIGVVKGYASWQTPLELLTEFRHPEEVKPIEKFSSAWLRMEVGSRAEEPILETAQADPLRPGAYQAFDVPGRLIGHPEFEWAGCSPDGLAVSEELGRCLLEAKNTNVGTLHKYPTDDGTECMPSQYRAQVLWNMACCGADTGILIASFNGDIKYRVVRWDDDDVALLMSSAAAFLDAVASDDATKLMDIVEDAAAMNRLANELFRRSSGAEYSIADPDLDMCIEQCIDVKRRIKELQEVKDGCEARIKSQMAESKVMETSKYRVSWGQAQGRTSFDSKALAAEDPATFERYNRQGKPYRTGLRMSQRKEK